jgi:hypothetical protein
MKQFTRILFAFIAFLSFLCTSCSDNAEERIEVAKIVETRDSKELMNDLFLACDGDVESLARILQCTPSSIDRIRNGKSEPTLQFEEKIKSIAIFYFQNDRKFSILQSALDPEYGWYDSILNFPSHHPWIFWIVNIILILLLAFLTLIAIWPLLLEILIFLIVWIASLICAPDATQDKYIDTINPVIEQLI